MGYCMDYKRVLNRNLLTGTYDGQNPSDLAKIRGSIAGDLRRLERDQRDGAHLEYYAKAAGITAIQAKAVLDAFLSTEGCIHLRPRSR